MSSDSHEQTPQSADDQTTAADSDREGTGAESGGTETVAKPSQPDAPRQAGAAKPGGAAKKTATPAGDGNKPVVIPPKAKPTATVPRKAGVASSARPSGSAVAEPAGGAARQPRKAGARKALQTPPAPPTGKPPAAPAGSKAAAPAAQAAKPPADARAAEASPTSATPSAPVAKPPAPPVSVPVPPRLAAPAAPPPQAPVPVPTAEPKKGLLGRSLDKVTSSAKGVLGVGKGKKSAADGDSGDGGASIPGQVSAGVEAGATAATAKRPRKAGAGVPEALAQAPAAAATAATVSLVGIGGETVAAPGVIATPQTKPTPVALGIKKMGRGPRKARVQISWVSPLSVMKVSFLLSIALGIAMVVAVYVIWKGLNDHEIFVKINNQFAQIVGDNVAKQLNLLQYVEHDKVMSWATVLAVVNTFVFTALGTIGGFLYNVLAALVGGIHVTFTENK